MNPEFLAGADVSMLGRIEELGGVFREGGRPKDPLAILTAGGSNCFRLRLFVRPDARESREGVVNDLPYTLALARRVKAARAKLLLDFHYSDTWADPGKQFKPADWVGLDFAALEAKVESYTADVLAQFRAAGVTPDLVQVGNEIIPGMLWPDGRLGGKDNGSEDEQWGRFVRLLNAGIRGVKKSPGAGGERHAPEVMIHIDRGGNWPSTKWFFENLARRGVAFDLIGQSYYPWWHGTLDDVRGNLRETARSFGKDVVIAETAYPHRDARRWETEKNMAWPVSPEGQARFLAELVAAVRATPGGHGRGVLYWYPEALPVRGMTIWHGGATALFDENGNALPGVRSLRPPAA